MKLSDCLERLDCRKDSKARRVLNVCPDKSANITAAKLESGVDLETLEALNVPVFAYGTQVTIHGRLPDFNEDAHQNGYRAVFRNGNGSIGVRYSAIDAEKKERIARACRVSRTWFPNSTSSGFEVSRTFYVRDESERENAIRAALADES